MPWSATSSIPRFEWIGHVKDNWNYRYTIPPQPLVEKVAALTAA